MIWSDDTHIFTCTNCRHLGAPCADATVLARKLVEAVRRASPFTAEDFEVTGHGRLEGCARTCPARFVANKTHISIYGDVSADTDLTSLASFADSFFESGRHETIELPASLDRTPCEMIRAVPKGGRVEFTLGAEPAPVKRH
ncbi:MAG: hypothetical protein AAGA21_21325 [Pseudomonadota bacterium]